MKLTKALKHTLDAHLDWNRWGEQFGFRLYGTTDEWVGHFQLPSGENFIVTKEARELIDARIRKG